MATISVNPVDSDFRTVAPLQTRHKPFAAILCLLGGDLVALGLSTIPLLLSSSSSVHQWHWHLTVSYLIALLGFLPVLALCGLYDNPSGDRIVELRRFVLAITFLYALNVLLSTLATGDYRAGSLVLLLSWVLAVMFAVLFRSLTRWVFTPKEWWRTPVAVFYTGEESIRLVDHLRRHWECGLRPIAMLVPDAAGEVESDLPTFNFDQATTLRAAGVKRAIIALPETDQAAALESLEQFESVFPHLLILHGPAALYTRNVSACEIGRSFAVNVRRKSLSLPARIIKRTAEYALLLLTAPLVLLAIGVLAALVKLDSPGPAFFGHKRIGRNNKTFRAWKLRTMQVNAAELLQELLDTDEQAREEWHRDRKLRNDPRVTRLGKLLRRSSLDELPQLWNVFLGEMSLVGPRPIIAEEVQLYGRHFPLYCRVTPGITGLWQVSGRSRIAVSERVQLDSYYVRNWSPWLDLHILARTAKTVVIGDGAY